ncbi:uncharacterized protein LOC142348427 [Convolutriloba macropyga]|uniref:uncharacterized protein LOC142348427 n=1 Tax=Convolutriloba macropyga TaxID=536237 RepID=UPI003F5270AB
MTTTTFRRSAGKIRNHSALFSNKSYLHRTKIPNLLFSLVIIAAIFCNGCEADATARNLRWGMRVSTKRSINTASDILFPFISQTLPISWRKNLEKYSKVVQLQNQLLDYQESGADYSDYLDNPNKLQGFSEPLSLMGKPEHDRKSVIRDQKMRSQASYLGRLKFPMEVLNKIKLSRTKRQQIGSTQLQ